MWGWNFNPFATPTKQKPKLGCDLCELYHDAQKFSGWHCVCECHTAEELKSSSNKTQLELEWDEAEEKTKPGH